MDGTTLTMDAMIGEIEPRFGPAASELGAQALASVEVKGDEVTSDPLRPSGGTTWEPLQWLYPRTLNTSSDPTNNVLFRSCTFNG
ncbi:MAG: hypothetical protein KAQ96_07985 [Thermoplasmata archaeon]|nr:hypothetical protein [Thermoplasmata archaeon]